jgi:hypothetical protein
MRGNNEMALQAITITIFHAKPTYSIFVNTAF